MTTVIKRDGQTIGESVDSNTEINALLDDDTAASRAALGLGSGDNLLLTAAEQSKLGNLAADASAAYAAAVHTHAAGDITSGTLDAARIPDITTAKISDLPSPSGGSAGQVVARNSAGTAYELVDQASGGGGPTFGGASVTDVAAGSNVTFADDGDGTITINVSSGSATVGDGDYGDITVSSSGTVWTVDAVAESVVTTHEAALTITESQISDLGDYVPEPPSGGTYYARSNSPDGWLALGTAATEDADAFLQPGADITSLDATSWRLFYTNGSGDIVELALGSSGQVLKSTGATSPPEFADEASGGGVDTSESTITPATLEYLAWNGATFAPVAAPASEPTNLVRAPSGYSADQDFTTFTTGASLLGVPAATFEWGGNSFSTAQVADIPAGAATGTYYFAALVDTSSLSADDSTVYFRYEIQSDFDNAVDDWGDLIRSTGSVDTTSTIIDGCQVQSTAANPDSRLIDRGNGIFEVILVVEVTSSPANDVWIGFNGREDSKSLTIGALTLRAVDYDPDDTGTDAAKVKPTGYTGGDVLTLTTADNQVASISADATLALPAAPGSGVRDVLVRVAVSGGSLSLPADAAVFGEAGPFSSDVRLAIRQYGDGSPADIYAVTQVA